MSRALRIVGVPLDLGQSKRGVDMGPAALRYAGLAEGLAALGHRVIDAGNLAVPVRETVLAEAPRHYLPSIAAVCRATYAVARQALAAGETPIFLGGDHSLAIGSIGGVTDSAPCGLLWIDAHADFNTPETTRSGNIHGMTLAVLLGDGYPELVAVGRPGAKLKPQDVVLLALRDLDPGERERLKGSGITVYTMRDIDERGIGAVVREALERLEQHHRLHVSLDVDCLDPQASPGVGTPVSGGLSSREAQLTMELIADCGCCGSLDIVEINPILDQHNRTAVLAAELAASLFGKRIL
ncbi:MAG: arginase [Desulfuromonadales bacterium GWD2_61_12]|nr:MAG: arginase [Desulfuromonadales bacterium GWC2_61_20]OGR36631.1 MAG: arginase [Desulfuromonadales bacterium GWD2_61_12]HAD04001.1 arginase [Desulfuromonas sp.]HBT82456.1 arginase [Desulfuromonas sp.]